MNNDLVLSLRNKTKTIRKDILEMIYSAGSGHPGGSLSIADVITVLYFHEMKIDPAHPKWPDRDRFILSKGHTCPAWYSCLAERGFFPVESLSTLRSIDSMLQGHPDMKKTPGIDFTTGSLGQGLSAGVGMALSSKMDAMSNRVYVVLGDGELNEGQVWEAVMLAAKYQLDNLVAIVDYNKLQLDGTTEEIMPLEPLSLKWKAFNWEVVSINGHDIPSILQALETAHHTKGKPTCIIAHTIKGKGISFMENQLDWHGKAPDKEQLDKALDEIGGIYYA